MLGNNAAPLFDAAIPFPARANEHVHLLLHAMESSTHIEADAALFLVTYKSYPVCILTKHTYTSLALVHHFHQAPPFTPNASRYPALNAPD